MGEVSDDAGVETLCTSFLGTANEITKIPKATARAKIATIRLFIFAWSRSALGEDPARVLKSRDRESGGIYLS